MDAHTTDRRGGRPRNDAISGEELRARIQALDITYVEAADRLGLTRAALDKQMRNVRGVSRQTEMLLDYLETFGELRGDPAQAISRFTEAGPSGRKPRPQSRSKK